MSIEISFAQEINISMTGNHSSPVLQIFSLSSKKICSLVYLVKSELEFTAERHKYKEPTYTMIGTDDVCIVSMENFNQKKHPLVSTPSISTQP